LYQADFYFIVEDKKLFIKLKNIISAMSSAKHKPLERHCGEGIKNIVHNESVFAMPKY